MKVMKFGGTSVGTANRFKDVSRLITDGDENIVVLSAMSGTTNSLVEISDYFAKGNTTGAKETLAVLEAKYNDTLKSLFSGLDTQFEEEARNIVKEHMNIVRSYESTTFDQKAEAVILARGELMSTAMMYCYLRGCGVDVAMLPALEFMRTNAFGEPDTRFIHDKLVETMDRVGKASIYITQGFICRNSDGDIDNLKRGGSDYTASLIGAAINADEIQIWTDIDGMHNNDPRYVEGTSPVEQLHFEEAAELAYFGAKILHPTCVLPAKLANIPVRLLNTMCPEAAGTKIFNASPTHSIKAVAAKDNITSIKIKSGRMLLAYGFLRKVFEIFEQYRTPIDMIATSEVGVSVTIDNNRHLPDILEELKKFGTVTVDDDMVIICVVGDMDWQNRGFEAEVVNALRKVPIRMISYGGSNYNISLLIRREDKVEALNLLSKYLFNKN